MIRGPKEEGREGWREDVRCKFIQKEEEESTSVLRHLAYTFLNVQT